MIRLLVTLFAGLFGLAFGSFLNVCLSRWPMGESVVAPRSHCRTCARTLAWWENIPLLSWIVLRGRCRTCKEPISWRYPLVEAAVGGLWALIGWRLAGQMLFADALLGTSSTLPPLSLAEAIGLAIFCLLMVGLAALDAEHFWLADAATLPGAAAGLVYSLYWAGMLGWRFLLSGPFLRAVGERLLAIFVAAGFILLIRWLYWIIRHREGLGLGDAKLMALLAAWLGLPGAALAFEVAVGLGTLAALVVLLQPRRKGQPWAQVKLPLGTFLCLGGIVSAFWGEPLIAFYMKWAGM
jgi:leader peptidase (prepilin peptidase)/N-methyltransferase